MSNRFVHNSKLFSLIKTLDNKELKQFDDWLSSKFHNNSDKVLNLYRGLRAIRKKLDRPVDKRTLLKYAGVKMNDASDKLSSKEALILRQTMSALTGQIQDFLCWQKFKEDTIREKRLLMDALLERKLYSLIPVILTKSKRELEASPHRNIQYYENAFQILEMDFYLKRLLDNRNLENYTQQIINVLWQYILANIFRYYCAAKNDEKILKVKYDYPLIEAIKQYADKELKEETPIVEAYYTTLCMIEKEDEQYFYQLKKYIVDNIIFFDITSVRQFLNYLHNYCSQSIKKGKVEFVQERHDIYKLGLELNCWTTQMYFSIHQFVHIVSNALSLHKTDWANNFIQQYQTQLNPDIREDVVNYCHALVAFQTKDYNTAQDYLIKISNTEDFVYHIRFKILLIKIYYEQEVLTLDNVDIHPINYELDAIRHYVMSTRNTKMSEYVRESYNNFVNLFKRILNRKKKIIYKEPVNPKQISKLKQELSAEIPFVERQWLKEKIEELV